MQNLLLILILKYIHYTSFFCLKMYRVSFRKKMFFYPLLTGGGTQIDVIFIKKK